MIFAMHTVLDVLVLCALGASHRPRTSRPSHAYNAGTEHVVFSPARQTLLAPSAKRRDVGVGRVA